MKRFISMTALLLLCVALLAACTPGQMNDTTDPGDHTGESADRMEPVTLDVYYFADDVRSAYIVNTFRNENITVNATAFSSREEKTANSPSIKPVISLSWKHLQIQFLQCHYNIAQLCHQVDKPSKE